METNGTKFILDLLAKNAAKINAATESNIENKTKAIKNKRKGKPEEWKPKKLIKLDNIDISKNVEPVTKTVKNEKGPKTQVVPVIATSGNEVSRTSR